MGTKETFWVKPPEKPNPSRQYLRDELRADLTLFPEEVRPAIEAYIEGKDTKKSVADKAIDKWWQDKYGFPFHLVLARNEVLLRKYSADRTKYEATLQGGLLKAMAEGDEEKIKKAKDEYKEKYPDELEGLSVILGFRNFLIKTKKFEAEGERMNPEARRNQFRDFTEYQFLLTHFLLLNQDDKEMLDIFWKAMTDMAEGIDALNEFNKLRRGLVTQVATHRILESLGEKPKLSHPDEDAFRAIDLWMDGGKAIQIKGWEQEKPAVLDSEHIAFPAFELEDSEKHKKFYNSLDFMRSKSNIFLAKIKKYGDVLGKNVKGFMLVIPYSKIDFITGEPAPELVEFFKEKLK